MDKIIKIGKEIIPYIIIVIVVVLFRTFISTPIKVDGSSMDPTLKDNNILILNKLDKNYKRFDIVVIKTGDKKIIKRIIGLPNEHVAYINNTLYINHHEVKDVDVEPTADFTLDELYDYQALPPNYYFVMGDNRDGSSDSRFSDIGLIKKSDILGTVTIRLWPFNKIGKV